MTAQWQWQSDDTPWDVTDPENISWTSYSPEENALIEEAYHSSPPKTIAIRNHYVIDVRKRIQYMQITAIHQRRIRRLSNDEHIRQTRFIFTDDQEHLFSQPFEMDVKFRSLMINDWHKSFFKSHQENMNVSERDILDAAIKGIEEEGTKRLEFRKDAMQICDELRQVRDSKNKMAIKECAVRLYTRTGSFSQLINKALRENDRRIYQNTLGPYCYLLYSYLCMRPPFDIHLYHGTVYRGCWLQPGMIGRFRKAMEQEKCFLTWLSFTSTTKSRAVVDMFHGNTLFEILLSDEDYFTSQGIDISHLSKVCEEEVLLPPGFQFEIVDAKTLEPTKDKPYPHYHIQLLPRQLHHISS